MSLAINADPDGTRDYGDKIVAVEPGGVEFIPLAERHGGPLQLLWTWASPNMEFATIGVGMLGVLFWGLTFWQTVAAIVLGTGLGSVTHGVLSSWGPKSGLCQMVLSRTGFGYLGNILPAGINALTAGIGWFAVNSISGALALHALVSLPTGLCLLIVVAAMLTIAFLGHNLVHAFERYAFPVLGVIFVLAAVVVFSKAHPGAPANTEFAPPTLGGFLLMFGAAFGYAAGWNPYAADYARYLRPDTRALPVALSAGLGVFLSCVFLEIAGAASITSTQVTDLDPGQFTALMPTVLAKLTLLAICLGAIAANALNVYSGAMSFMAMGIRLPTREARAVVALILGTIGFVVAYFGIDDAGHNYETFLLVIAYWIAPWLGVVLVDRWLRRGQDISSLVTWGSVNLAGPIAMLLGVVISIWLFANQFGRYVGPIPTNYPSVGDITFEVGFVISAVSYAVLHKVLAPQRTHA